MKRRKAKQQLDQQMLSECVADIREKDKERIIFFRQIGEIADKYAWKGIHPRSESPIKKPRSAGRKNPYTSVYVLPTSNKSMVPFPSKWMDAVFEVSSIILYNITSSLPKVLASRH